MKTRSFLRTSFVLGVFATTSILPAHAFARVTPVVRPIAAPATKTQESYVKALPGANGTPGVAQTAIRRFTPIHGNGPSVYLVAAIHIGEKSYYKQIQQFLDKQGVVLYEGVRPSRSAARMRALRADGPRTSGVTERPVGIQRKLSDALNLQFQGEGIHYDRPQFRNSDLDWDTMNALAIKAGPDTQKLLAGLKNSVSGGPNVTRTDLIVDKVLTLSASTPLVATILRRLLITVLCNPEKIQNLAELQQEENSPLESAKKLDSILVNERNKTVLTDLKALLKRSKRASRPLQSIAIFYGAAHLKDIEQHLVSDLGYRATEAKWITAIKAAH